MKKIIKLLICALMICIMVIPMTACQDNGKKDPVVKTGTAYGLVHGGSYVGKATITKTDDKVTDATLEEMCLPTQVKATAEVAEDDRVDVTTGEGESAKTTYYYKTVKYDNVTMTYDAQNNSYMVGDQKLADYLRTEANCKAYFEAAAANNLSVMVGGKEDKTIMTNDALNKDKNGYWTKQDKNNKSYSRWKVNRDATVNYVKQHGLDALKNMTQAEAVEDAYGAQAKYWQDANGVSTGATWSDMYKATAPENYYTYVMLLNKAAENAQ